MNKKLLRCGGLLGLITILMSTFMLPAHAAESKAACVFVSIENSAWIFQKNSQVKSTLKVGDVLNEGDRVMVLHGNKVQLAFDKEGQNIVEVQGDALFYLTSSTPPKIELLKGKMFAVLDRLPPGSEFLIQTASAITAVQGTQYQITTLGDESSVMTYRGQVTVSGRGLNGEISAEGVVVSAGKKTSVAAPGQSPASVTDMNASEKAQIDVVLRNADKTRGSIDSAQVDSWLSRAPDAARVKTGAVENTNSSQTPADTNTAGKKWVLL